MGKAGRNMERTVKKRQSKSQPLRIVRLITAVLGIGGNRIRKVRKRSAWFGIDGRRRRGFIQKGAFGKCKYLKGRENG